ncbi:MAG: NAD-dependent epimerase/dehydratase family protein [Phycisphaerales bacterium]
MNILVLGGTQFSGRAFVEQASSNGHHITLLHRSPANPGLPDGVKRLVGDRDPKIGAGLGEIQKLIDEGHRWDAVVDMCGYVPRVVRESCELLKSSCDLYLFISTISVYPRLGVQDTPDEDSPLNTLKDNSVEEVNAETYGGLKVLCEQVVTEIFQDTHCIVRPGIIAGPNDPTDRITWWARMLGTQDRVIVPAEPAGLAAFIDARDLAAFFETCITSSTTGIYNAVGPEPGLQMRSFISRTHKALDSTSELIEATPEQLAAHDLQPWVDIPTWALEDSQSMYRISASRAFAKGLQLRPLEETMRDVNLWDIERGRPELKAGMSAERMQEVIDLLK